MLNSIVDGISIKLNSIFGDSYETTAENVEQGLQPHSFFIKPLPVTHKPLLGKRAQRTYPFVIAYFPDTENMEMNAEMMGVAEKLLDGLEYITLQNGEMIRGHDLEPEIVDGVLHFSVKYIVFINKAERGESMGALDAVIGTKGAENGG